MKLAKGMVKVNWDAAIDILPKRMGVGTIIRNAEGTIMAIMCTTVPFITDPTVTEAVALWKVASFCLELGFQRLHLEGDALEIVQTLQQRDSCFSRYGQLIDDTRVRLSSLQTWHVSCSEGR